MNGKFKGESAVSTYVYAIAKFKWLNELKKTKIRDGHYDRLENEEHEDGPLAKMIASENEIKVMALLEELGIRCKKLLIANVYHNQSMKEIALSDGFSSEQVVRNKKYKCLKKLKELLDKKPALIQILKSNG